MLAGTPSDTQAEQADHPLAPRIQLARRMRISIDGDGGRADALQPDGLPHDQQFVVGARANDDQIARRRVINRSLDRLTGADIGRSFAGNRYCDWYPPNACRCRR